MALNGIKLHRGVPRMLDCDNGSEFSSQAMDLWAYQNGVRIAFSRPGKPTDNAFVESFISERFGDNAWMPIGSRR